MSGKRPLSQSSAWRLRKWLTMELPQRLPYRSRKLSRAFLVVLALLAILGFSNLRFPNISLAAGESKVAERLGAGHNITVPEFPMMIVTKRGPGGKDIYPHSSPYEGIAYHVTTTVGPAKELTKTHFMMTSLWFFEDENPFPYGVVQQQVTERVKHMEFECVYNGGQEVVQGVKERQIRGEYLHLECDVPSWLAADLDRSQSLETRWKALQKMKEVDVQINVWIDMSMDGESKATDPPAGMPIREEGGVVEGQIVSHHIGPSSWEAPDLQAEIGICVSPLRFNALMTMTDVLEWRLFHAYQGIERVHWYSRTPEFGKWVKQANDILGFNDSYLDTPNLSATTPDRLHYADQALWYQDCVLRYGFFDEWLAVIDIDEYLFPIDNPAQFAARDRIRVTPWDVGTIVLYQTYFGGERVTGEDVPSVEGFDQFPRNAFTKWQPHYIKGGARFSKAVHRAQGVRQIWVHNAIHRGWWYLHQEEYAKQGNSGVLQALHSRREAYKDMVFEDENRLDMDRAGWNKQWKDLAEAMKGLEVLHTLPS